MWDDITFTSINFFKKLDDLSEKSVVINEFVTSEKVMEMVFRNDLNRPIGLPHEQYIKVQSINKIVERLSDYDLNGDVPIEDIINETNMNGVEPQETYELLELMKRFGIVDEVQKNLFRSTSELMPLQPDIAELMKKELRD